MEEEILHSSSSPTRRTVKAPRSLQQRPSSPSLPRIELENMMNAWLSVKNINFKVETKRKKCDEQIDLQENGKELLRPTIDVHLAKSSLLDVLYDEKELSSF